MQFTIAQWSGNVAKGKKLKLADFLPKYLREKTSDESPERREARVKQKLNALARFSNTKKNG